MNSVINKTRLAEKRYEDNYKKDKEEVRINTKKHRKRKKQIRKSEEG